MSEERLLQRVEKLEKTNKRLMLFGGAALAGLGLLSASSAMCDTVWAERFVLRDQNGTKRIMLDAYHTQPNIAFYDAQGKKQIATIALGKDNVPNWTCHGHAQQRESERESSSSIGN